MWGRSLELKAAMNYDGAITLQLGQQSKTLSQRKKKDRSVRSYLRVGDFYFIFIYLFLIFIIIFETEFRSCYPG